MRVSSKWQIHLLEDCTRSLVERFADSHKGAFRSFRNLNRRGLQPLVSVDAFAATRHWRVAAHLPLDPFGCTS